MIGYFSHEPRRRRRWWSAFHQHRIDPDRAAVCRCGAFVVVEPL